MQRKSSMLTQVLPNHSVLAARWTFLLIRGLAGIALGVVALVWPGVTLVALALLFGAYAFVDGAMASMFALLHRDVPHRWLLVVEGIVGVVAGIATAFWPGVTLLVLVLLFGARCLVSGIFQVAGAFALRSELETPGLYALGGLASIVFGALTLALPGITAQVLVTFLGVYAILFGIAMIALSFRRRAPMRAVRSYRTA